MAHDLATVNDLSAAVGEGGELSGLDKKLIEFAAMKYSGEQMSEELGGAVSPARAVQRVREILRSQDVFSIVEQQSILMLDMIELRTILFERVRNEGGEVFDRDGNPTGEYSYGDPRWAANLRALLKDFAEMLRETQKMLEKNKGTLRQAHADQMMASINLIFERLVFEIEKQITEAMKLEPDELETDDFIRGYNAHKRESYKLLPTRLKLLDSVEHLIPIAAESIEAKVIS